MEDGGWFNDLFLDQLKDQNERVLFVNSAFIFLVSPPFNPKQILLETVFGLVFRRIRDQA